MKLSKLNNNNITRDIISNILSDDTLTSSTIKTIDEFYNNLPEIVENKKDFVINSIEYFLRQNLGDSCLEEYCELILKVIDIAQKNILVLEDEFLNGESLKIKTLQYFLSEDEAIITFINNKKKILFKPHSLKYEKIFNELIKWLNIKSYLDLNHLYTKKIVTLNDCGFIEIINPSECKTEEDLLNYYYKSGLLLTILYILNIKNIKSSDIVDINNYPVIKNLPTISVETINFPSTSYEIAQTILDSSVYHISFLPERKNKLNKKYTDCVKQGFTYMYNTIVENKLDLVKFISIIFDENDLSSGNVISKIYSLNEEDLKRQLYFIDVKLLKEKDRENPLKFSKDISPSIVNKEELLKLALSLGDCLVQKGIIGFSNMKTGRTWISTLNNSSLTGERSLGPIGNSMDYGNSGIALFLAYLSAITKREYFLTVAMEAMESPIADLKDFGTSFKKNSENYTDIIGEVYVLSRIYILTKDENIKEVLEKVILSLETLIKEDSHLNTIKVSSGTLAVLLDTSLKIDDKVFKNKLGALAKELHKSIIININIINLHCDNKEIIAFLSLYLSVNKDKEIESTIKKILTNERNVKSKEQDYSEILRTFLYRLILKKYGYVDSDLDNEINYGLNYIMEHGFYCSSHYFNGHIGTLDVLKYASKILNDEKLYNRCQNTFDKLLDDVITPSIRNEIINGNEPLSLMSGVAGFGYSILRKYDEELVPDIIWFQ